jgi:hypothetical protein
MDGAKMRYCAPEDRDRVAGRRNLDAGGAFEDEREMYWRGWNRDEVLSKRAEWHDVFDEIGSGGRSGAWD